MKTIKNFLRLVRFPNLIIVAITQYLLQYKVILSAFSMAEIHPLLTGFHFFLFVCSTMIIAAGGYIINDIVDYPIDVINKPEKLIINKTIPIQLAQKLYYAISIFGLIISLYLAIYVKNLPLVLIYPAAVGLLWCYSHYFKKQILIGNIIVSIFCAFVAGVVLFAERHTFFELQQFAPPLAGRVWLLLGGYTIFAFLSTLFREIIKDIEDIEGDQLQNCQTLPIVYGLPLSKSVAGFVGFVFLIFVLFLIQWLWQQAFMGACIFAILGILIPLIFSLIKLIRARDKTHFHLLSQLAKWMMLAGLLLLLFL